MSSKGISPVVATVLLMGIAIAAVSSAGVFLSGTMDDIQQNVESWLMGESRVESSEIGIDYGYNGTNGFLLVDVRNLGSRALAVEEGGTRNWNMYVDNVPQTWEYIQGSDYENQDEVIMAQNSVITVNTTVPFPSSGSTTEVELTGPYEIQASYVCFSENGGCES